MSPREDVRNGSTPTVLLCTAETALTFVQRFASPRPAEISGLVTTARPKEYSWT